MRLKTITFIITVLLCKIAFADFYEVRDGQKYICTLDNSLDCRSLPGKQVCDPGGTVSQMEPRNCPRVGLCLKVTYEVESCQSFDGCGNFTGTYQNKKYINQERYCTPCP